MARPMYKCRNLLSRSGETNVKMHRPCPQANAEIISPEVAKPTYKCIDLAHQEWRDQCSNADTC